MPDEEGTQNQEGTTAGREGNVSPPSARPLAIGQVRNALKGLALTFRASLLALKGFALVVAGLSLKSWLRIGAVLAAIIILGATIANYGGGSSPSQPVTEADRIIEALANAGQPDEIKQTLEKERTPFNNYSDNLLIQIKNSEAKLTASQKPKVTELKILIETTRSLFIQTIAAPTLEKNKKIIENIQQIQKMSIIALGATEADLLKINDAPIEKIVVYKSVQNSQKRRMYFYGKDNQELGSVRVEIGINRQKTADFKRNDKATPTGRFELYLVEYRKSGYKSTENGSELGQWKIRFRGDWGVGDGGRPIIIHGNGAQEAQSLIAKNRLPIAPTLGCVEVANTDLDIIGPLMMRLVNVDKKTIALEIKP